MGNEVANEITTVQKDSMAAEVEKIADRYKQKNPEKNIRIRRLTPKECTRLMDFDDKDYEAMHSVNSDTQVYKQCGNSIVVSCLYHILKEMCK